MSLKVAVLGMVGAVGLGMAAGGQMRPALALQTAGSVAEVSTDPGVMAPADISPPYVSPASLQAWTAQASPNVGSSNGFDVQVRRELAQVEADLRASEVELAQYSRAAVLTASAVGDVAQALASDGDRAVSSTPGASEPQRRDGDAQRDSAQPPDSRWARD